MPVSPPVTTLAAIEQKVRRLTRSPSNAQLTTLDLENYINTFVVYDFPEHLRMFNQRQTFSFVCNPYQERYPTDEISFAGATSNPLYDFQNRYLTVHPPLYVAGFQSFYTQSREQFYGIYPNVNSISQVATGDNSTVSFTGTIVNQQGAILIPGQIVPVTSLLPFNVLFSSVDNTGQGVAMQDVPVVNPVNGNTYPIGNLYVPGSLPTVPPITVDPSNNVNYITGVFTVTFPIAPASGVAINTQTVPTQVSMPQAMLFYADTFFLRPVPDQPYTINFEVYVRPTYLMETSESPALNEWWQYIAYGAAKKIFEDRMDLESVQMIMPEFKKQEALCLRRTIVQYTNERTATIYTEQTSFGPNWGGWGFGGGNF